MQRARLLRFDAPGWRMVGPGGFRAVPGGRVESYGGPGLFWYSNQLFEDFALWVEWRLSGPEDNSGVFLRFPRLTDSPQPAIERGYEVQIDDRGFNPKTGVLDSALHLTGAIYELAPLFGAARGALVSGTYSRSLHGGHQLPSSSMGRRSHFW